MEFRSGLAACTARLSAIAASLMIVALATCIPATPAAAQGDLYTVAVPLDPKDPQARDNAYRDALTSVLIRVTGSDNAEHLEHLGEIFANPARYVLRYRPGEENTLVVSFDGDAIEQLLRRAGQPIWGAERPLTLVWLAVDWGDGEREIVSSDDAMASPDASRSIDRNRLLRARVEETAERRGIPVVFPLLDIADLQNVSFSDIWGGFDQQLLAASRRYGASSILVGRVAPDAPLRNRWTYYFGEDQLTWSGEPEVVVNLLADELAAQFAIRGDAPLETYRLTVDGVNSVVAYGQLLQFLDGLTVVERFMLRSVGGRQIEFSVQVYGGIERLRKALELSGILQPVTMFDPVDGGGFQLPDPDTLQFEFRP